MPKSFEAFLQHYKSWEIIHLPLLLAGRSMGHRKD
jgi:hypothetical protein